MIFPCLCPWLSFDAHPTQALVIAAAEVQIQP